MNRYQCRLCRVIQKKKYIGAILRATGYRRFAGLESALPAPRPVTLSTYSGDPDALAALNPALVEELEHKRKEDLQWWSTFALSVVGAVCGVAALVLQVVFS